MTSNIHTLEDVQNFARELVGEGCNFHPDDDFHDFKKIESGESIYGRLEAIQRNQLMLKCFSVCETIGEDIYSVMGDDLLSETGLASFIPLSTQKKD
jgi:hypothetical protein